MTKISTGTADSLRTMMYLGRRRTLWASIAVVTALILGGCDSDSAQQDSTQPSTAQLGAPTAKSFQSEGRARAPAQADRKEVVTGSVNVTASDPIAAAQQATTKVEARQGRVDDRTEQPRTDDSPPSSSLTVRVPADQTDAFVDDLRGIGEMTNVSISKNDVTMQVDDVNARIKALQTSVDRLRALIASATNTADLIEAEKAVSDRQGELDGLTAQQRRLADQVDLSTVTVQFTTDDTSGSGDDSFWDGIVSGWHSLISWLGKAIVWIGSALPWIAFFAIVIGLGWLIVRLDRRRRR